MNDVKKTISAEVILDSINEQGDRLTTMVVTYPRFILPEFNTHRVFSRGSASSRAIPVKRRIAEVLENIAWPVEWGQNQKGMQAEEELFGWRLGAVKGIWKGLSVTAAAGAWGLSALGLHKQLANRPLEPYLWNTMVVSSTRWENFFSQRCHKDAQPEMRTLAKIMREKLRQSSPTLLNQGKWHLPFIYTYEQQEEEVLKRISVARCARVSYLNHRGLRDLGEDLALFDRLMRSPSKGDPPHAGPFEHVATPGEGTGNFKGWNQFRHSLFLDTKEVRRTYLKEETKNA